jgi:hypothetical protein
LLAVVSSLVVFGMVIADSQADPVEFNPTVAFSTSTTLAGAHPDAQVTITNPGSEDLKSVTLDLPDGMWGSLAAVATPCTWANAAAGTCPATTKVGTIVADAKIDDSDARLRGTIYLTDPNPASPHADDGPAWLSVVLPAKVGGVDFGKIITPGRLEIRHNQTGVPTNVAGPIYGPVNGVRTIVDDIPRTVTDDNSARTLTFHVRKMQIDLRSNQSAPQLPLLTNPGSCSTTQLKTTMTSYDSATVQTPSANYTTDGCASLKLKPQSTVFELSNPTAFSPTDLKTTVEFPAATAAGRSATIASATVLLPSGVAPFAPDIGSAADMCSASTTNVRLPSEAEGNAPAQPFFRSPSITWPSGNCPSGAKIGTAKIWTPLLPDPVTGNVWAINRSPLPHIAIDVNPSIPGNPKGVNLTLIGESGTQTSVDGLGQSIRLRFGLVPDAPVTKIEVDVTGAPANGGGNDKELLYITTPDNPACQANMDFASTFNAQSGSTGDAWAVGSAAISGCDPNPLTFTGPVGGSTTSTTPSFGVTNGSTYGKCTFRTPPVASTNCPSGTTTLTRSGANPLANGLHAIGVATSSLDVVDNFPEDRKDVYRYFAVDSTPAGDTTPPNTSITTPPSDPTSDTTPSFSFSSPESVLFECQVDGGAFLPCGSASAATTGSDTVGEPFVVNDDEHTIAVRARDAAGNVDASPATATFSVVVPFDPTFAVALSTSQARQHPTMDVTITSGSHEDMKNLALMDSSAGSLL